MKKSIKIITSVLALIMLLQTPFVAMATTKTVSPYTGTTYTHQSRFDSATITYGIDVSKYQGTIDFKKVKADGVKYVILRVGYRGYGVNGTLCADTMFDTYLEGAKEAGLQVGVYYYSQAINKTEAKEEAKYVLDKLNGCSLNLPVYYDVEFASYGVGRLWEAWDDGSLTIAGMTQNVLTFCEEIEKAGYTAGLYSNKDFLTSKYNTSEIENAGYDIWLAHYISSTDYTGKYTIWQYSSKGTVDGISGSVDCNFRYLNANSLGVSLTNGSTYTYTGSKITPSVKVKFAGQTLKKGTDYTTTYSSNTNYGRAKIKVTGIGDFEGYTKTIYFYIVPKKATDVELVYRGITAAKIKWSESEGADGYEIKVYKGSKLVSTETTTSTSIKITSLTSATEYRFRVYPYITVNSNNYLAKSSTALNVATTPSTTKSISLSSKTANSATIKWNKVGNATKYRVYLYNKDTDSYEKYKDVTTNKATIKDLNANTAYKVKIKAFKYSSSEDITIKGAKSEKFKFYTRPDTTTLKSAKSTSTRTITAKWKTKKDVDGYYVQWSTTKDFSSNKKIVRVSDQSVSSKKFETVRSNTVYYVRVRTYANHNGEKICSAWSDAIKVTTK